MPLKQKGYGDYNKKFESIILNILRQ